MKKSDKNHVNTQSEQVSKKSGLKRKIFIAAVPVVLHLLWHIVLHFGIVAITAITFKTSLILGIVVGVLAATIATVICVVKHKQKTRCTECGLTAEEHHKR